MTRILVQRGSGSSSSNQSRAGSSSAARQETPVTATTQVVSALKDDEIGDEAQELVVVDELLEYCGSSDNKASKSDELLIEGLHGDRNESLSDDIVDNEKLVNAECVGSGDLIKGLGGLRILERPAAESESSSGDSSGVGSGSAQPPPPPVPPPKPLATNSNTNSNSRRFVSGSSNSVRIGSSRRAAAWPIVSTRTSPSASRPSSPRSHVDSEGYNSADEQNPCFVYSYDDLERERQFEIDIRRSKGLEVKRMLEDGNCLFRAVADQVYGDSEVCHSIRQMCIDYMERERDHFSQFITEGFTSYCKRKRRDKVYGNNVEIQALSEMYNRPIHIYSYSTEPINIFHGGYNTDTPPIRLSYHHGNHYNSLVDPRQLTIGAGLGFSCLRGTNVDRDQVKAAIKAQQDQQIDNALLAEVQFYSDLELTEKEIERMVMEASRAEYLASDKLKQQLGYKESSTSGAEPSSSGARSSGSETKVREQSLQDTVLSSSVQMVLSMGFRYRRVIEAYSIFGDDVDAMVRYLLETGSSRRKGKATE
ncbi:hypothetical protein P3X46_000023 [Hevea brasiliensis]|uniref:OTU domain-containing protein n=1 Tax=Hevea brasiliensis TaxID=3981 RepID=A0ABQ9NB59_HEVBR|nr:OVARIAN TUMOR DOMAIN-containing deubiquitinating enzyme 6 [Hevea brasiliensis]XP_021647000.1 OVARIAN TUMOR DOMAIN-containing deubiquitinating enzyme 6 [Hevea brasiliensis]KAJ9188648.1 hypothetical protein P3X46_000023 [Hevea brasiliensis]